MGRTHTTEHTATVNAPPSVVFDLIARAEDWPHLFPPNVHVERLEHDRDHERLRIWATVGDEVKSWTSRRRLDRTGLRVRFRQEVSAHPVAAMGGEWVMEPLGPERTRVRFTHDFEAVGDDPGHVDWIRGAIDRNTPVELASLDTAARNAHRGGLAHTFEDTLTCVGEAERIYGFLYDAARWEHRLPHVVSCSVEEDVPGVQTLDMDTRATDGSTHTTRSVRICFPLDRIVYKQLRTPALLSAHTGEWRVTEREAGVEITSRHSVVIDPDRIENVLGEDAGVEEAYSFVRNALGRNSLATMEHARTHAEKEGAP